MEKATVMTISAGDRVWFPCEVNSGPFAAERRVLVNAMEGESLAFVNERWLEHGAQHGKDRVLVMVVQVRGDTFTARLPGPGIRSELFEGALKMAERSGSLQA